MGWENGKGGMKRGREKPLYLQKCIMVNKYIESPKKRKKKSRVSVQQVGCGLRFCPPPQLPGNAAGGSLHRGKAQDVESMVVTLCMQTNYK